MIFIFLSLENLRKKILGVDFAGNRNFLSPICPIKIDFFKGKSQLEWGFLFSRQNQPNYIELTEKYVIEIIFPSTFQRNKYKRRIFLK